MNPNEYKPSDHVAYVNWWRESAGEDRLRAFNGRFKYLYDTGLLNGAKDVLEFVLFSAGGSTSSAARIFKPNFGLVGTKPMVSSNTIKNAFRIENPNALYQSKPGFSDPVSGSSLRTGRGHFIDFSTHQQAINNITLPTYNSYNLGKMGRWGVGLGLSGSRLIYEYNQHKK